MSETIFTSCKTFPAKTGFKEQALQWASAFKFCSYFTSNGLSYPFGPFPEMLAIGTHKYWQLGNAPFDKLLKLQQEQKTWLMGYFTYELKNEIHGLESHHPDTIGFPSCVFYQPDCLFFFREQEVEIQSQNNKAEEIYRQVLNTPLPEHDVPECEIVLKAHMNKAEYLQKVAAVQQHILEGDCYELNLCQEYSAQNVRLNPLSLFRQLNQKSPAPFACFQRYEDHYLLCASPERFLKKEGDKLISQPIKGTIRRGSNLQEDEQLKNQLRHDEKEMAENMMIVDLVRNDLAMSAVPGSVRVAEMFGIYSFRQLHQMISTVESRLRPGVPFTQAIRNAFPMGSMTGAPKRKVMELIEVYEKSRRGLYSGATGFISPEGDFDFNVVIRSILYNAKSKRLSYQVGGAITYDSDPEKEYEECLLKARAMQEVLSGIK